MRPDRSPPADLPRPWEWIAWVVAAFALHLLFGWFVQPRIAGAFGWEGDDGYDEIARLWIGGHGYVRWAGGPPTLERLPLYPILLAGAFRLGGERADVLVYAIQSALSALSLLPLGALASRLGGRRSCRLALALGVVHPVGILYNFRFMTEPLHSLLVLVFLWLLARWIEDGGVARAAGSGAVLGAVLLTRSSLAPLAPLLAAAAVLARVRQLASGRRRPAAGIAAGLAAGAGCCLLVLAPWLARAGALGGGLISSGSAAAWYHGLDVSRAAWQGGAMGEVDRASDHHLEARLRKARPDLDPADAHWELERESLTRRLAWEKFRADPGRRAAEWLRNLVLCWYLTYTPGATLLAALVQVPLLIAAAVAVRRRARRWPPAWWPVLALVAGLMALQAAVYPHFRFMAPATWGALALAAEAWAGRQCAPRGRARTLA